MEYLQNVIAPFNTLLLTPSELKLIDYLLYNQHSLSELEVNSENICSLWNIRVLKILSIQGYEIKKDPTISSSKIAENPVTAEEFWVIKVSAIAEF